MDSAIGGYHNNISNYRYLRYFTDISIGVHVKKVVGHPRAITGALFIVVAEVVVVVLQVKSALLVVVA